LLQKIRQRCGGSIVRVVWLILFYEKGGGVDPGRLHVLGVNAVITDQRVGHGDDLAVVGRIRQDLLVAAHGGVEDDLADGLARAGERAAVKYGAVFQGNQCTHKCCWSEN
jgi:hypothetical protein